MISGYFCCFTVVFRVFQSVPLSKNGTPVKINLKIISSEQIHCAVPLFAIVRSTEQEYVIAARDGKAELVSVKEGLATHDSTEVFGSLKANDRVLLHASDEIKNGDKL